MCVRKATFACSISSRFGFVKPEEKLRDMFVSTSDAGSRLCCDSEVSCGVSAVLGRVSVSGVCFSASFVGGFTSSNKSIVQSLTAGYGSYVPSATCQPSIRVSCVSVAPWSERCSAVMFSVCFQRVNICFRKTNPIVSNAGFCVYIEREVPWPAWKKRRPIVPESCV